MAITGKLFAKFPMNMGGGDAAGDGPMDLLSDTIKLTLHTSTWTPNQSTNEVKADATNELTTAGGYTALGQALASKTYTTSSLVASFDAADVTWTGLSVTYRYGVLWDDTPTTPADPLIGYVDSGGDQTLSSTDLVFQWNSAPAIFQI
ncbi:MAG TPA: hypothetical protein VHM25_12940, partial [Polyangiaceae bacterium]|nr:hypothetical protein [Polyangiaceae bacterium]